MDEKRRKWENYINWRKSPKQRNINNNETESKEINKKIRGKQPKETKRKANEGSNEWAKEVKKINKKRNE